MTFGDRYQALGIPYPNPDMVCQDQCEGTGWVPVAENNMKEPWRSLWLAAEGKKKSEDGWHFVRCPSCDGTGRRS